MSVRNCMFPWHWLIVSQDGDVSPCGHGSKPVGNLREQSADEIWNGKVMQSVRAALLLGQVHSVCESAECPYQREHLAFTPVEQPVAIDEALARAFDDTWYLEMHSDVQRAVERRQFASGLEHFARHGRSEGRAYRLVSATRVAQSPSSENAALALIEYSRRAIMLRSRPVDVVFQVSTICNLRCVMCPHGRQMVDRPRHMPPDVLERAGPFIHTAARMIVSGLGEPFLAPAFWRLIALCAGREELFIRANSNALFVDQEKAACVLDSGLKEISFSLDAATPATYARIRGADFARARRGVETMCAARAVHPNPTLEIFINMTLMRENVAEAPQFVELAASLGVDAVLFSQLFPFGDEPGWRLSRADWVFNYSEQMLSAVPRHAALHLERARVRAEQLGVKIIFQSNTDLYRAANASDAAIAATA